VFWSSMYVLLRGQVTVYHTYDAAARDGSNKAGLDDVNAAASWTTDDGYQLRQQLGASVVTLNGQYTLIFSSVVNLVAFKRHLKICLFSDC